MHNRAAASATFLKLAGWGNAKRSFLAGDASDRRYDRLKDDQNSAVLMDAPPGTGDDPVDFIKIGAHLNALGLSAPRILSQDLEQGFLLIEDLGDRVFARILEQSKAQEMPLYEAATDVLIHIQSHRAPPDLPNLEVADWAESAALALECYRFGITGDKGQAADFISVLTDALLTHADGSKVLILRDYHAENLLWLPDRPGLAGVGLLDFQLGQLGHPAYDLVSLLQDARRDVHPEVEAAMINRFCAARDDGNFPRAYAAVGAQRALRIMGVFTRLCLVSGKPHYLALIPRVWAQLQRNLSHPHLAPLAKICADNLPEPTPDALERIRAQCKIHPMR